MSIYTVYRLFCDGRNSGGMRPEGYSCSTEFEDPQGRWLKRAELRREAAKAGWTYVRHPRTRGLDQDLCPAHKPTEGGG